MQRQPDREIPPHTSHVSREQVSRDTRVEPGVSGQQQAWGGGRVAVPSHLNFPAEVQGTRGTLPSHCAAQVFWVAVSLGEFFFPVHPYPPHPPHTHEAEDTLPGWSRNRVSQGAESQEDISFPPISLHKCRDLGTSFLARAKPRFFQWC